jgi:hypothetical protein
MYVFGHHLASASLMYYLSYGDECVVEYRIVSKQSAGEHGEDGEPEAPLQTVFVKSVWFGSRQAQPGNSGAFMAWRTDKGLTERDFYRWVKDQLPAKPFFPFISDVHSCRVVGFMREEGAGAPVGLLLEVGVLVAHADDQVAPGDEPRSDTAADSDGNPAYAILLRQDVYVCGVALLEADLRLFFRPNDVVLCQLKQESIL